MMLLVTVVLVAVLLNIVEGFVVLGPHLKRYAYRLDLVNEDELSICGRLQAFKQLDITLSDRKPWIKEPTIAVRAFLSIAHNFRVYRTLRSNLTYNYEPGEDVTTEKRYNIGAGKSFERAGKFCITIKAHADIHADKRKDCKKHFCWYKLPQKALRFSYPFTYHWFEQQEEIVDFQQEWRELAYLFVQGATGVTATLNGNPMRQLSTVVSSHSLVYILDDRGDYSLRKPLEICFGYMIGRKEKIYLRFLSDLPAERQKIIHLMIEINVEENRYFADYTREDGIFTAAVEQSKDGQKQTDIYYEYKNKFCMIFEIKNNILHVDMGDPDTEDDVSRDPDYPGNDQAITYLKIDGISPEDILHIRDREGTLAPISLTRDSQDYDIPA